MDRMVHSRLHLAATTVFVLSVATIVAAWAFEVIGGYLPCPLCLRQRVPYYLAVPLSGLALLLLMWRPAMIALAQTGLATVGVIMLVSFGLGAHHAGIEWQWWEGPAVCAIAEGRGGSSLLPDLDNLQLVRCDEVQWRLFGLSFAGYNALISLVISATAFWGAAQGSSSVSQ